MEEVEEEEEEVEHGDATDEEEGEAGEVGAGENPPQQTGSTSLSLPRQQPSTAGKTESKPTTILEV